MAYNTRRNGGNTYMTGNPNIGQRRPQGGNYMAGAQQVPRPPRPQPNLRQQAVNYLNQQQQHQQQPQLVVEQQAPPPPVIHPQQQQQQTPPASIIQQQIPPPQQQQQAPPQQKQESFNVAENGSSSNEIEKPEPSSQIDQRLKKAANKPFWIKKEGKITKKERLKRRNQRLRKILQPKNALMVLNELVGSTPYNVIECADMYEGSVFRCNVLVDGLEHQGIGKSKPAAKTAAAEAALKHLVLNKLKTTITQAENVEAQGDVKMEVETTDDGMGGISWSHVACYALHKLLRSWDEGSTNIAEKLAQVAAACNAPLPTALSSPNAPLAPKKKPAKKLPETASTMNPLMLLFQMLPDAVFEEIDKVGNPPNIQFTMRCTINGDSFIGSGSTKKAARKLCAFAACHKLLQIEYSQQFLEEHGVVKADNDFVWIVKAPVDVEMT